MKLLCLYILLMCTTALFPQEITIKNFNSMVATEFQFAARALQVGSRDAFLEFIDDEGILFRPTPVNGKEFLSKQNSRPGFLIWYPSYAFISKSGDMGCTTGPAEFKRDMDSNSTWFGNFCTVWKLQSNGNWKFLIDGGISNNKPVSEIKKLIYDSNKKDNSPAEFYPSSKLDKQMIFSADEQFNSILINGDFANAYVNVINDETRLLREGELPIIGTGDIIKHVSNFKGKCTFQIIDGRISNAGDFGYVYGSLEIIDSEKSGKFNYIRMWSNDSGNWKIIIELFSPLPE